MPYPLDELREDMIVSEPIFDYKGVRYIISTSIQHDPKKGKWICIGTDGSEFYANSTDEMLDAVVIDGEKLRNLLDVID